MVGVTAKAAKHVKTLFQRQDLSEATMLRFIAKAGGCSGYSYLLDFDKDEPDSEKDSVYESNGVRCVVDKKSEQLLDGTIVDFQDGLRGQGFIFFNPKATSSCGCGMSFSA